MASSALLARREARRRKILENSGNRLKRITGRIELAENSGLKENQYEENGSVHIGDRNLLYGSEQCKTKNEPPTSNADAEMCSGSVEFLNSESMCSLSEATRNSGLSVEIGISHLATHLVYISIAILFRILVGFKFQYSMVFSFLITKLGLLCMNGFLVPESSRFLRGLLLLYGISPEKVKIVTLSISTFYSALIEFALYTFVFVLTHTFVTLFTSSF